jgi:hypothetical protein
MRHELLVGGLAAVAAPDSGAPPAETVDEVRRNDLATVFAAGPQTTRVTRMRADLSQAALANDAGGSDVDGALAGLLGIALLRTFKKKR